MFVTRQRAGATGQTRAVSSSIKHLLDGDPVSHRVIDKILADVPEGIKTSPAQYFEGAFLGEPHGDGAKLFARDPVCRSTGGVIEKALARPAMLQQLQLNR